MNITSRSLNSSTMSTIDTYEDPNVISVKNYVKELLKSRIFLGRYVERRLINEKIGYRDIVLISAAEVEFKKDLLNAQEKLRSVYSASHWIGISESQSIGHSPGIFISTEIDNEPLGPFWFQVKSVKFRQFETMVSLKCIRHISDAYLEIEPILTSTTSKSVVSCVGNNKDDVTLKILPPTDIFESLKGALTISNIKEFITFIFAFVIAIFTGSTSFVNFVGNFILALIRELSIFVRNSTPIFLGFLDFLTKIVGGFYILLAMFFKPNNPPRPNKRRIDYNQPGPEYSYRSFD